MEQKEDVIEKWIKHGLRMFYNNVPKIEYGPKRGRYRKMDKTGIENVL
jgi:hypothetical protein